MAVGLIPGPGAFLCGVPAGPGCQHALTSFLRRKENQVSVLMSLFHSTKLYISAKVSIVEEVQLDFESF